MNPSKKILVLGAGAVGKTYLVHSFIRNKVMPGDEYLMTIGVEHAVKIVRIGGIDVSLQIWDIAGQKRFEKLRAAFYEGAQGAIFMFDLAVRDSLDVLFPFPGKNNDEPNWYEECFANVSKKEAWKEIPCILVGGKADLRSIPEYTNLVTPEEGTRAAKMFNMPYIEVSARIRQNVDEVFEKLAELILKEM